MTKKIMAVTGVSGVGKSTLLKKVAQLISFQHLQASDLIRLAEQNNNLESIPDGEELRHRNLDENQIKLILGFQKASDPGAQVIVLDSHSVIDGPHGYVKINPTIFRQIGITQLIMLLDAPEVIQKRRNSDGERKRPIRSTEQIAEYQNIALTHGASIALELQIPFIVLPTANFNEVLKLF